MTKPISCEKPETDHKELYRLLVRELRDYAVFMLDESACVASWNEGVTRILGYEEEEFIGTPFAKLFTPEDRAKGAPERELATAARDGRSDDIRWHVRQDGSQFWCEGVLNALLSEDGKLLGFSKIMRDATARKMAEKEREKLLAELQRSNEELTQFSAIASHDLQAPLRAIRIFAELLQRRYQGKLDATADEFIKSMLDGTAGMEELIRALLQFAQAGERLATLEPVSIREALETVLLNLQPLIAETGATIRYGGDLPTVKADWVRMVQIFQNLIGNAIKYQKKDVPPVIEITAERQGGDWLFAVVDNGIGIDSGSFDRVFEPLKRLHGREIPGTGIGLAVCKKITQALGGRIWIESEPGRGSTFFFTIPCVAGG